VHALQQPRHDPARRLTVGLSMLQRKPDSGLGNIRSSPADPSRNIDWILLTAQTLLTIAGCFVVFSATRTRTADPYTFVTRQVIFAIAAVLVMAAMMAIDYEWWRDRIRLLYLGMLVVLFGLAAYSRGSGTTTLAIDVGPVQVQPAEFAKVVVLLAVAAYLSEERTSDGVSYPRFLGALLMVGIPALLVIVQPDLGTGSVLIAMTMGVLLVAGAKARYIFTISLLSIATIAAAFVARLVNPYQLERVRVFFDQDNPALREAVYQVDNAVKAVGTGGVFGKGWLQGPLTNGRDIPVIWADFPFAAVGEQFGLIGCAALLLTFAVALLRIWRIAGLSRDMFGTYICAGTFTMLLWQVFQNVGMTVKIMPVTGLPMPFISYGGSGLITWFALFGLVQSVHMRRMR
jgi:rod shape determining protein RodA